MSTDAPTYIDQATDSSPFSEHRAQIFGGSSAGETLRAIVMACWNGDAYPVNLSKLTNLDGNHRAAALAMLGHYAQFGERDKAFMAIADEIHAGQRKTAG